MQKLWRYILLSVLVYLSYETVGFCQESIIHPETRVSNQIFLKIGLEPEMVTTIGFTHLLGNTENKLAFGIGASLKLAPLILSNGARRFNIITVADWHMDKKWATRITNELYLAQNHNVAGTMNGLGFELRSTTVHYGRKWNNGFDLGWQYTIATHVEHSDIAKATFRDRYPEENLIGIFEPKDGWYKAAVSRFRIGYVTSTRLNDHLDLQLGIGSLIFVQKQGILLGFSHAQVPAYFESAFLYHW